MAFGNFGEVNEKTSDLFRVRNLCLASLRDKQSGIADLKPGFRILVDLRNLRALGPAVTRDITRAMDLCNEGGVSKVVRVVPGPLQNFGFTIMSHFHYGNHVQVHSYETMAEADQHLCEE